MRRTHRTFSPMRSRRSSAVDCIEEMSLESPREMQDEQEAMNETSGTATSRRREDGWRLEPEGERETLETEVFWNGVEGIPGYPYGEGHHKRVQVKSSTRESEAPGEEGEEVKSPKRKEIRVESEETQDYVRETNDMNQEESEEISFVPIRGHFGSRAISCSNVRCVFPVHERFWFFPCPSVHNPVL